MRRLIYLFLFILASCTQSSTDNKIIDVVIPPHPWFTAEKIQAATWRISDHGEDNIYLLEGSDSALVIDTGIGAADLTHYLRQITKLPFIVINTHGHPDHVGSNNQFATVRAHPDEFGMIQNFTQWGMHKTMLQYMVHVPVPDSVKFHPTDTTYTATLIPVADGRIIDLGARKIEVIYMPGHTKGSICLLDHQNKLLFTGDNIKPLVWMHMEESVPLDVYLNSLQEIQSRVNEFTSLLPGHDNPIDTALITEQIACVRDIISGKCKGKPYESVVGNGLICEHERSKIAYSPEKIKGQ